MNKAARNSRSNSNSSIVTNESKSHQRRSFFGFGSTTQQEEKKPKMEDATISLGNELNKIVKNKIDLYIV